MIGSKYNAKFFNLRLFLFVFTITMSDKQIIPSKNANISKEMQMLYGFFNKNVMMLKDIYIQHRVDEGIGLLSLFLLKQNGEYEVKVGYMKRDVLPEELQKDLDHRVANNTTDIIYFYMNTVDEANLIETDIRDLGKKN